MSANGGNDAVYIAFAESVVHGKAYDAICHTVGNGEVVGAGTVETAVGTELADERVEIAAGIDALLAHAVIELVACLSIFLLVNEDGEI